MAKDDANVAPVGSNMAVSQPAIRFDCSWLACVRLFFRWGKPDGSNITNITPRPTDDERDAIAVALFDPLSTIPSPLRLAEQIDVFPCLPPCQCRNIRGGSRFGPRVVVSVSVVVTIPTPTGNKTFNVTLGIPARVAVGVGRCRRS
jgi:hypothetical protein